MSLALLRPGNEEWERCRPWLESALSKGGDRYHTIDDIFDLVTDTSGDHQFWPGKHCALVTQFWYFPRAKVLNCWLAGGDLDELLNEMQPDVLKWAKAKGCTEALAYGRRGWERRLKAHGYAYRFSVVGKSI